MTRKRIIALVLALILIVSAAALVGCGNNQTGGGTGTGTGGAGGTGGGGAADNRTFELVITFLAPSESAAGQALQRHTEEMVERSEGRLSVTHHWGPSLMETADLLAGVTGGIADIAMFPATTFADFLPLNFNILCLPFLGIPNSSAASDIYYQLVAEFPEIEQEFTNIGLMPLGLHYTGRMDLYLVNEVDFRTPEDLRGRRILVTSPFDAAFLADSGAAPVTTTMVDIYPQLSGGIAEGIVNHSSLIFVTAADIVETIALFGEPGAGAGMGKHVMQMVINPRTYNNLPEDLQSLVRDTFYQFGRFLTEDETRAHSAHMGIMEGNGANIIVLNDAEIAEFIKVAEDMHAVNIAAAAGKGATNAQAIYDRARELAAQHR
jgi:TRAP-type C4-dicarboxylate transport system substrate-binding protein